MMRGHPGNSHQADGCYQARSEWPPDPGRHKAEVRLLERLKTLSRNLRREITIYRCVLKDPRRLLLWLAVGYTLLPFDLIPDFIPVIGHLDDVVIVPALLLLALKLVPPEVVEECRRAEGK